MANGLRSDIRPPATYVLVIDDEPVIADTLVHILRNAGFAALAAYDGQSALESAKVAPPQVVIADVGLGRMNGVDVAMAIEDSVPDAKALLLSAGADFVDLSRARALGHDFPMLAKPVSPNQLLDMVRHLAPVEMHDQKGKVQNENG